MRFQDSFLRLVFVFTAVFTAEIPQVGATEALPVEIMPIGDSITRGSWTPYSVRNDVPGGYRKTLFQQLVATGATVDFVGDKSDNAAAAIDPHHNGNDGWRTDQMLAALPTWLAADPDVVLLKAGTNDILQQKTVPDILRNLENLILETVYDNSVVHRVESTLDRELIYNIEHAIHHMAMIKIGLKVLAPELHLPENFGVAPSTIRYRHQTGINH